MFRDNLFSWSHSFRQKACLDKQWLRFIHKEKYECSINTNSDIHSTHTVEEIYAVWLTFKVNDENSYHLFVARLNKPFITLLQLANVRFYITNVNFKTESA